MHDLQTQKLLLLAHLIYEFQLMLEAKEAGQVSWIGAAASAPCQLIILSMPGPACVKPLRTDFNWSAW